MIYLMGDIIEVRGTIVEGFGYASNKAVHPKDPRITETIRKQKPYFEGKVPGIKNVFDGTLNIDISPRKFRILRADHEVECEWERDFRESFQFVGATLKYEGGEQRGWIYYPMPGPHKAHPDNKFEFLAPWIEGLKYGQAVTLAYDSDQLEIIGETER